MTPPSRGPERARPVRAAALGRALVLAAIVLAAPRGAGAAPEAKDPARAITSQLICPCSCGEVLSGCTCDTGKALQAYVEGELKAGKDKHAIEAALVAKYGEVILGAPKAKGFNAVVWIAPFVATAMGFAIASMVLARWVRRKRAPAAVAAPPSRGTAAPPSLDASIERLRARAEAEMRELKR